MKIRYVSGRRLSVLLGLLLAVLVGLAVYWLKDKFQKPPQAKKLLQQITMIQPPPPPPPDQKTPEPEIKEEKLEEAVPEPEQEPEPAPEKADEAPAETLGLDAEGSAGSDGFGLEGRKGGRSILGGSNGSMILWYGGQIKRQVEDGLQNLLADSPAAGSEYAVTLEIWVGEDGRITRSELTDGSGKAEVDQAIRRALPKLRGSVGKSPPQSMPQPIRMRLTSRV